MNEYFIAATRELYRYAIGEIKLTTEEVELLQRTIEANKPQ